MLDFTLPNNRNILLPFLVKRSIYSEGVFFRILAWTGLDPYMRTVVLQFIKDLSTYREFDFSYFVGERVIGFELMTKISSIFFSTRQAPLPNGMLLGHN